MGKGDSLRMLSCGSSPMSKSHKFESFLSALVDEVELDLNAHGLIPCLDHWLNPRRLRGSDFLMRWFSRCMERRKIDLGRECDDRIFRSAVRAQGRRPG
jgi:hypothetical protein